MSEKKITLYRAVVRVTGSVTTFLHGPYRLELGFAEVDRLKILHDRKDTGKPETFEVQRIPAKQHDDGSVTIIVRIER